MNGGAKPDGDTLPFIHEDPGDWKLVARPRGEGEGEGESGRASPDGS
ncbi:hypothetical protein [Streptomyces sp. NPDC046685]